MEPRSWPRSSSSSVVPARARSATSCSSRPSLAAAAPAAGERGSGRGSGSRRRCRSWASSSSTRPSRRSSSASRTSLATTFVGLDNYQYFFSHADTLVALRNNVIWLVLLTALAVGFGLLIAVLVDRVRYETGAKSVIFLPLAISFVGGRRHLAVHVRLRAAGRAADRDAQRGRDRGSAPAATWLPGRPGQHHRADHRRRSGCWTGFCMVILSAGAQGHQRRS